MDYFAFKTLIGNLSMKDAIRLVPASWADDSNAEFSVKESCVSIMRDGYTYTFEGDGIVRIEKDGHNPRRYDDHGAAYHMENSVLETMRENYDKD